MSMDFDKMFTSGNPEIEPMGANSEIKKNLVIERPIDDMVIMEPIDKAVERAKKNFAIYEAGIAKIVKQVWGTKVDSEESLTSMMETMVTAHKMIKRIEVVRKDIVADASRFVSEINTFVRFYRSKLDECVQLSKQKIGAYGLELEQKRREEQKRAEEEIAKRQAEIDKAAKKLDIEPIEIPKPVIPQKQEPIRTKAGSASVRTFWDWEVVAIEEVPEEFIIRQPNKIEIKNAIDAGRREIPGLRIFENSQVISRTTN